MFLFRVGKYYKYYYDDDYTVLCVRIPPRSRGSRLHWGHVGRSPRAPRRSYIERTHAVGAAERGAQGSLF